MKGTQMCGLRGHVLMHACCLCCHCKSCARLCSVRCELRQDLHLGHVLSNLEMCQASIKSRTPALCFSNQVFWSVYGSHTSAIVSVLDMCRQTQASHLRVLHAKVAAIGGVR